VRLPSIKLSALPKACLSARVILLAIRFTLPGNKDQMRMAKLPALISGFQMTDIVSVTVYVTDLNDVEQMNVVYKKLMPDPKPARATVQVAGLIGGAKIEISAIAVKH
jgi:hypothetical protein